MTTLRDYFARASGLCVLSSADGAGRVTAAVYSAPRFLDDGSVAFLMRERRTWHNVGENPYAACLFVEHGGGYRGLRLMLRRVRVEDDPALVAAMTRRHLTAAEDAAKGPKHLVVFAVEKVLPLVGDGDPGVTAG